MLFLEFLYIIQRPVLFWMREEINIVHPCTVIIAPSWRNCTNYWITLPQYWPAPNRTFSFNLLTDDNAAGIRWSVYSTSSLGVCSVHITIPPTSLEGCSVSLTSTRLTSPTCCSTLWSTPSTLGAASCLTSTSRTLSSALPLVSFATDKFSVLSVKSGLHWHLKLPQHLHDCLIIGTGYHCQ